MLSVYTTLMAGDLLSLSWSIGGPAGGGLLSPLLGQGKGLSGTHNKCASRRAPPAGPHADGTGSRATAA